jgi:hypothetical protein
LRQLAAAKQEQDRGHHQHDDPFSSNHEQQKCHHILLEPTVEALLADAQVAVTIRFIEKILAPHLIRTADIPHDLAVHMQ